MDAHFTIQTKDRSVWKFDEKIGNLDEGDLSIEKNKPFVTYLYFLFK